MHHCDVLCLVLSSLCSLQAYYYAEHLYNILLLLRTNSTSPPTHFTRAPPSHAKNRYLNNRLMILQASELATELFDELQSLTCTFAISIATRSRVRNEKNRLSQIRLDGVSACTVLRPEYKTHKQKDANSFLFVIKNKRR